MPYPIDIGPICHVPDIQPRPRAERARVYRSSVIRIDADKKATHVYATGSGDKPLDRVGRKIDHADLEAITGFSYPDLPLQELTGILAAVDLVRGS